MQGSESSDDELARDGQPFTLDDLAADTDLFPPPPNRNSTGKNMQTTLA